MNIQGIKLVTGEEVIADVSVNPQSQLQLKNPVQLRVAPPKVAGASPQMGFIPFPTFSQQKEGEIIIVEPLHVVYTYTPASDISDNYNQMFGSGIITPPTQIITG
jgi:hypothetical protein